MGTEIERKFVVDPKLLPTASEHWFIEQFYIAKDPWMRARVATTERGIFATLTVKGPGTLTRAEFEWKIPVADALEMKALFGKGLIKKCRHIIYHDDCEWVVDQFFGPLEGLWLAEIELDSEIQQFVLPPWAIKEVTEDERYSNAWLIENGLPLFAEGC